MHWNFLYNIRRFILASRVQKPIQRRPAMYMKKEISQKIRKEASDIAKCAGLMCSRLALLLCLILLLYPTRPTSVYLLAITALFPWIFGNILEGKQSESPQLSLSFCARKYLYTPARYLSEKCAGGALVIFLTVWQFAVTGSSRLQGIWKISPAGCLFIYCLCRLISTLVFRRKIHREYFDMKLLEHESMGNI